MTPLARLVAVTALPVVLVISMTHLVGAEERPGDGFTAGIIAALGLTLAYELLGYEEARRRIRGVQFEAVLGAGLLLALLAAAAPVLAGAPVLATGAVGLTLPLVGTLTLGRAFVFDVGVFLVVVGGVVTALDELRRHAR